MGLSLLCQGLYEQQTERQGLSTLILWCNGITANGMEPMAQALAVNKNISTLNMGYNPIGGEGVHHLREGLLRNSYLEKLSLQVNSSIF